MSLVDESEFLSQYNTPQRDIIFSVKKWSINNITISTTRQKLSFIHVSIYQVQITYFLDRQASQQHAQRRDEGQESTEAEASLI